MSASTDFQMDKKLGSVIIKRTENWIVSVTPMIYNDRVLLTLASEYDNSPYPGWEAGWCYDKGGAAVLAAVAWDPETEREPLGYKKLAADRR